MKKILIGIIKIYQKIPGPWHGYCKHLPTCSEYMKQAIEVHGILYGVYLGIKRLLKCNPWGSFGYDPVPKKENKNKNEKQN